MDRHSVPPGGPSQNPRELRLGLRPQVSRTGPGEAGEGSIRQTTPQHETLGPLDSPKDKLRTSGQARWEGCCSTSSNMGRAPPSSDSCRQTAASGHGAGRPRGGGTHRAGGLPRRPQGWGSQGVCDHSKHDGASGGRQGTRSPTQGGAAERGVDPRPPTSLQPTPHGSGGTTNLSHLLTPVVKVILSLTEEPLQPTPAISGATRPAGPQVHPGHAGPVLLSSRGAAAASPPHPAQTVSDPALF